MPEIADLLPDLETRTAVRHMNGADASRLVGSAVEAQTPNVTTATQIVDDTGEPLLVYLPLPGMTDFRRAILSIQERDWSYTRRSVVGVQNVSRTFGNTPRSPTRAREACQLTIMARDSPAINAYLADYAAVLADVIGRYAPRVLTADAHTIEAVLPEWRLTEAALWTSGVINKTSQLPYHRDGSNFDAWSAMPVLRRGVRGGHLHLPEFGLTVECRDGWGVFFNGHVYVHGVTPMRQIDPSGYRISVVYYALRRMKDCHTFAEETARGRRLRTSRETANKAPFRP